ncbi:YhdH/YhfP family quinone oxidoreductase [Companilactobacillus insicii]|uniref:YhdH/YhfP family quinone oxidoreductase n=1 Tax=Companilactobacillus insicii TaxID=1732567 RepID=UPI000F7978E4|nr:YhdH/YhfP family quinone oxidoreductase [Companilactobacillus insicii]
MKKFKAITVDENGYGIKNLSIDDLSAGNVLIKVMYSSLNYKDMLAVQPNGGVIRSYPMIPGIDLSGIVVESDDIRFEIGDEVLVTGFKVGMSHTGGLSEYARIPADWIIKLPSGMSMKQSMMIGTAGFTSGLSVEKLLANGMSVKDDPQVLVTGSTGGVGSVAVQILLKMGFNHINSLVRKDYQSKIAMRLGAANVVDSRNIQISGKPLEKQRFDFVLDTVGGNVASELLPQICYGGSMTMCGNAGGISLNTTVLPFILRGINILGIDSVSYPIEKRSVIWNRFVDEWNIFENIKYNEVNLDNVPQVIEQLRQGKHVGRTIVKISEKI